MKIIVETRDGIIWNKDTVTLNVAKCMSKGEDLQVDLNREGPDCRQLGLYKLLEECAKLFDYDISKITLYTCNAVEKHDKIDVNFQSSLHLLSRELDKGYDFGSIKKNHKLKHFGRFIGRSNAPRLLLSTYLDKYYADKSILTYQYKFNDDYHRDEIGLESLINDFNKKDLVDECTFLQSCPRQIIDLDFKFNKSANEDFSTQLYNRENGKFVDMYSEFFVEIISETYYSGNTFFLTEKIFRPIILKTPFIVQGSQNFLHHLRHLGFKTFDRWWDEGYSEDDSTHQPLEIVKVIDYISKFSNDKLSEIYKEMTPILEHNYDRCMSLTENDIHQLRKLNDQS
jgi:hypothetical protein